ncbi:hypothetical protein CkaCkLH20_05589 [Colletotrichum karsti]|uniref:Uncharacterized protein n=1 Tax=Colletotrichum karsti TaxID=1095194 RepID=A0A9P6I3N9_9PEZI|nr:uncharacterized protein CkaCkLH20_05589 [Colletotrichum karsti]KAF9876743.1 hypothetical protein CkaCkLH20_05589 [Colletotrichum karsti]
MEHVRTERETQELEARWRRRLQASTPPQASSQPPLIIGAPLGKNLNAVEAATRLVSQWEAIYHSNPALSVLEALNQARTQLTSLQPSDEATVNPDETITTTTPLNYLQEHKQTAISDRIKILESALLESSFPPERANISAAISLYRTSRIPYSSNWALIYAGALVDFAPTYSSFTSDRAERLDRYERMHGPGWLWFEPPLARDSAPLFSARRGTWVPETDTSYDMGHYSITMSFRRMKNIVHRGTARKRRHSEIPREDGETEWPLPESDSDSESSLSSSTPQKPAKSTSPPTDLRRSRPTRHPGMRNDSSAPTLHFRMLLDSGATLPMLYDRDAAALGINRKSYAAVSRIKVETAGDVLSTWLYEMQVSIVDTTTCDSLVSSTSPVWPAEEHALGGIVPVMVRPSPAGSIFSAPAGKTGACAQTVGGEITLLETATSIVDEAEGRDYGRLSGLLPFKCCYVQSTPGLRALWLGEDRRDVLGAQRMPGQMRWAPGSNRVCDPGQPRSLWKEVCGERNGKPVLLRMAHENDVSEGDGGDIVRMVDFEEKNWKGRSEVLVVDGDGVRTKHIIEPRSLRSQGVKKRKLAE